MTAPALHSAIRDRLAALATALGGSWAFVESSDDGLRAVATSSRLAGDLTGPGYNAALQRANDNGIVLRVGAAQAVHPAGGSIRTLAPLAPVWRTLIGEGLPGGPPSGSVRDVLRVLGETLNALAEAATRVEEERQRTERLELRAATDPLTGLLNRRGWDQLLVLEEERCARHGLEAEVVVVDLDGLKQINDHRGHEAGDALIVRAATFIFSAVRIHDAVARLGGDEFAVLSVGSERADGTVAQRVEAALADADIAASVGWSDRRPPASVADAWRQADVAMYRVKQRRRRPDNAAPPHGAGGASAGATGAAQ